MKQIAGGVCAATGFSASGVHCGIRKNKPKRDLALIYSSVPASAAAVYTTNLVKGAPLVVTKQRSGRRQGAGHHLQQRQRQHLQRQRRCNRRADERASGAGAAYQPVRRCGRVYRRDRPAARHCAHRSRNPGAGQLSRPALRRGCRGHHDHRYKTQRDRRQLHRRREGMQDRRHLQRLRHDPPQHGDHARLHHDRLRHFSRHAPKRRFQRISPTPSTWSPSTATRLRTTW